MNLDPNGLHLLTDDRFGISTYKEKQQKQGQGVVTVQNPFFNSRNFEIIDPLTNQKSEVIDIETPEATEVYEEVPSPESESSDDHDQHVTIVDREGDAPQVTEEPLVIVRETIAETSEAKQSIDEETEISVSHESGESAVVPTLPDTTVLPWWGRVTDLVARHMTSEEVMSASTVDTLIGEVTMSLSAEDRTWWNNRVNYLMERIRQSKGARILIPGMPTSRRTQAELILATWMAGAQIADPSSRGIAHRGVGKDVRDSIEYFRRTAGLIQ